MGSGKTSTGKRLATELSMQHIDLDAFIEARYCKSVQKIFSEDGENYFRNIEQKILLEVSEYEDIIISTGGGTPCFFDNMHLMNRKGFTVFLDSSVETLAARLESAKVQCPLLQNKTEKELAIYIASLLEQRRPFYDIAQLTILPTIKILNIIQNNQECLPYFLHKLKTIMTTYESDIKTIRRSAEESYLLFADLNNIAKIKDKIPTDKVKSLEFYTDSCSLAVDPVGKITFVIENREPFNTIKFGTKESPVPFNLWIQFKSLSENDTRMKLTIKAELPMMIKTMFGNKIQDFLNSLAEMMSTALNNYKSNERKNWEKDSQ